MNTVINTSVPEAQEVKSLNRITQTRLKTKVKLEIRKGEEDKAVDWFTEVGEDVTALKIKGQPLSEILWTVEGAAAIGRIVNRSHKAFARIGIATTEMGWEDSSGIVSLAGDLNGNDLPLLTEVLTRLATRACAPIGGTQHPLTLYDLKQSIGIVYDAKTGDETAIALIDWFDSREFVVLNEVKEAKAKAKAKAKAAEKDAAKPEAGEGEETKPKNPPEAKGKAKSSPKPKAKASLIPED